MYSTSSILNRFTSFEPLSCAVHDCKETPVLILIINKNYVKFIKNNNKYINRNYKTIYKYGQIIFLKSKNRIYNNNCN